MKTWWQRFLILVGLCLSLAGGSSIVAGAETKALPVDPIFDVDKLLATPLDAKVNKQTEKDGIVLEELMYHSEMDGDKRVDIFALFAYPKGARKLPAILWVMPGLAAAGEYWPTFFAKRGYACLCPEYPQTGYRCTVGYNIAVELPADFKNPAELRKSGIYHTAVALLKGTSFLQARPEVDKDRIGVSGSSWGGLFTTLMVGLDPRLKVGSSFFGCGNLQLGSHWWGSEPEKTRGAEYCETWRATLDPAFRLANRPTPIAWVTGANDSFFWMPSLMRSYESAAGAKSLGLLPNWNHALSEEQDEQVFAWLDAYLKGEPAFLTVSPLTIEKEGKKTIAAWTYTGPRKPVAAELIWSLGENNWIGRYWMTLPASLQDGRCTVELPKSACPYHISGTIIDEKKFRYSTPLLHVDPKSHGLADGRAVPAAFDGCALWDDFEAPQIAFLTRCALFAPETSKDAKRGAQAALLKNQEKLAPVFFVPGAMHVFTAFLKRSTKGDPIEVEVALEGSFDGKAAAEKKKFQVKSDWTEIRLEVTAPALVFSGGYTLGFAMPQDAGILVDDAHFRLVKLP